MSLTRKLVDNRHAVWAIALAAAIFGTLAYTSLPMQLFPDTSPPLVNVITAYPGASAEDVAAELSQPLEEEIVSVEGVVSVSSSAQDNMAMTTVEFQYDRDADLAAVDVQNAISRIRGELPDGIREPRVSTFSTGDRPIVTIGVGAEKLSEARRQAEEVFAPRLQRIEGVAGIDVFGGAEPAVLVELDPRKLEAHRIRSMRVVRALRTHDMAGPAGRLRTERTDTSFRVEARARNLEELADIPLTMPGGSRVRLGDLGEVRRGTLDDQARFAIDGERLIAMQLFKGEEANTVEVVGRVEQTVDKLDASYSAVNFRIGEESASFTEQSIGNLLTNIWQALLLASIIIFLFIGSLRASLVAIVSMPLSYGLTFAVMRATGTEFNMVTLSAVILAVGMVVDSAVVVLENIVRRRDEDDLSPEEAVVAGTDEVRLAVVAGVGTTITVLVPLLFVTGFVGKTFGPLAKTLIAAFSSSVLVALTVVPILTLYTGGPSRLDGWAETIAGPFRAVMSRIKAFYLWLLDRALDYRGITLVVALGLFVGGVTLIRQQGMEVLPAMDSGSFFVSLETPAGTSLEETERVVGDVEKLLDQESEVITIQSQTGFEQGMTTTSTTGAQGPTQGFISVTLTPRDERSESIWEIEDRLRDKLRHVPGIRTFTVRETGNTAKSTTKAPVVVRLSGPDPAILDRLGDETTGELDEIEGLVDPVRNWRRDQRRQRVVVDELRAARLGFSPADIARRMAAGAEGVSAGVYEGDRGDGTPIRVRYDRQQLEAPTDLLDIPVLAGEDHRPVPLRNIAHLEQTRGQALVTRENLRPTLEITAQTRDRALSFVMEDVERTVDGIALPDGYAAEVTGERSDLEEAKTQLGGAFGVALVAVYLLLVAQLRSFVHPLTVIGSIPLSLIGVGTALWLAGKPVSMPVMIGFILLVGIVVNNAILLIDFIRQARERGEPRRQAITESVAVRFRPIMMTSFSSIIGMIPLAAEWALGAERFSPLAIAVIGGLTAATFLTMVVIPVVYDLFDDIGRWLRALPGRLSGSAATGLLVSLGLVGAGLGFSSRAAAQEADRLTVEQAVDRAHNESYEMEARRAETESAEHRRNGAWRGFLPRLDIRGRASKVEEVEPRTLEMPSDDLPQEPPEVQFGEPIGEMYSLRATLTQPLFSGFGLLRRYQAAGEAVELADARSRQTRQEVRLEIVEAYFGLHRARSLHEVARQSVSTLEAHLARVREMKKAGRATRLDVSRVESRLASARGRSSRAESAVRKARLALTSRLDLGPSTDIELADGPEEFDWSDAPDTRRLIERAVQARPEIEVAREASQLRDREAEAARGKLWPQLSLQAGYTLASPHERYFPPREEFDGSWDVSLVLSWQFDWGRTLEEARAADGQTRAARARVHRLERATRAAVERRLSDVRAADQRVASGRKAVESAEESLRVARKMFEAGRVTTTDVLDSELQLAEARSELVEARVNRRLAIAALRRVVGGKVDGLGMR